MKLFCEGGTLRQVTRRFKFDHDFASEVTFKRRLEHIVGLLLRSTHYEKIDREETLGYKPYIDAMLERATLRQKALLLNPISSKRSSVMQAYRSSAMIPRLGLFENQQYSGLRLVRDSRLLVRTVTDRLYGLHEVPQQLRKLRSSDSELSSLLDLADSPSSRAPSSSSSPATATATSSVSTRKRVRRVKEASGGNSLETAEPSRPLVTILRRKVNNSHIAQGSGQHLAAPQSVATTAAVGSSLQVTTPSDADEQFGREFNAELQRLFGSSSTSQEAGEAPTSVTDSSREKVVKTKRKKKGVKKKKTTPVVAQPASPDSAAPAIMQSRPRPRVMRNHAEAAAKCMPVVAKDIENYVLKNQTMGYEKYYNSIYKSVPDVDRTYKCGQFSIYIYRMCAVSMNKAHIIKPHVRQLCIDSYNAYSQEVKECFTQPESGTLLVKARDKVLRSVKAFDVIRASTYI